MSDGVLGDTGFLSRRTDNLPAGEEEAADEFEGGKIPGPALIGGNVVLSIGEVVPLHSRGITPPPDWSSITILSLPLCACVAPSLFVCICLCLSRISLQDQGMISFLSEILFQKMSFTFHEMFHCPKSEFGRRRRFNLQCAERDGERHRERERVHRERQRQREYWGDRKSI
jgi:hypothetical protein